MFIVKKNTGVIIATLAIVISGISAILGWTYLAQKTSAADMSKFDPGNIMSDAVMSNKDSMSVQQIQAFLNSKNACNNTNTYMASWYPHLQYTIRDGKFVCMAQDTFNGKSAAQIIWQVGQDYNINPQFLIVLLEKEQGLVTDTWPNHVQYRSATGFGCPDTAACDSKYFGLENQLVNAANLFRTVLNGGWSNYPVGWTYVQYNPNASCGGKVINIQNRATSALYRYTPYQPNQSALNAGYGTGDSCGAYGNRNTWALFTDWFGDTINLPVIPEVQKRYDELGGAGGALGPRQENGFCNNSRTVCWQRFTRGYLFYGEGVGAWESKGAIRDRWGEIGYQNGPLGLPTGPENASPNGVFWQEYQNGFIVGSGATGFWESKGSIRSRWRDMRFEFGPLGLPTGPENASPNGVFWQEYQNGFIVGSGATGFWEMRGGVKDRWNTLGGQSSSIGMPISPVTIFPNGVSWQEFKNGFIIGNPTTKYWESKGAIRTHWASIGYQNGKAGWPVGPELYDPESKIWSQQYQNGHIYYSDKSSGWFVQG